MSLLAWTNAFNVGVEDIDQQHRTLVELVNRLNDAVRSGQGKESLAKILAELVSFTVTHFAFEEELMDRHKYPMSMQHKQQHKDLVKTVVHLKARFEQGDAAPNAEMMTFLRDWLSKHIMNSDRVFGRDLNNKGIH